MAAFRDAYLGEYRAAPLGILDVGSAAVEGETAGYRDLFAASPWTYRGLDMAPGHNVDIVPADPYRWDALPDLSVDVVVSGQAFEHIEWPWLTMREIARVLRGGGLAAIIAPSAGPVHRFPKDCWRYYPDGMPALASYAGLDVVETHWDEGYAYPENAFWGEACAILQRPRRGEGDSVIAPAGSRDAIAGRVSERLAGLNPSAVRGRLLAETARRAWFILRSPLDRLTRF
ncbi:MAG TPA: methyltransferase domain-containing protein [Acetobacteraceae bacterium]|nr:methyltransferase domain-containing protein [Acetobacteraceae bacterium]